MSQISQSAEYIRLSSLIDTLQQHPTSILENERSLMTVKWFDYRFLSPKEANRLFQKTYQRIYKQKIAKLIDVGMARNVSGVKSQTLATNARERSQLVMARQRADASGMSYPAYIEACFDFAANKSDKRSKFPQPNQLHGNKKSEPYLHEAITKHWNELMASDLVPIEHPAYLIENYKGLPAQDAYRRFILDYVRRENIPLHRAILKYTYTREQMPLDIFKSEFEPEIYDQAIEIVASDLRHSPIAAVSHPQIDKTHLWPTCFGMHYTHQPNAPECMSCPLNAACMKVGNLILSKAAAQAGVSDPAGDYEKRLARDRKREQRVRDTNKDPNSKPEFVPGQVYQAS